MEKYVVRAFGLTECYHSGSLAPIVEDVHRAVDGFNGINDFIGQVAVKKWV